MPDPTAPEASVREQQLTVAQVLVELLSIDSMPAVSWGLSAHSPGYLDGIARSGQSDEGRRDDVAFWADLLEVDVTEQDGSDVHGHAWTDVTATGTYHGVPVRVWGRFDRTEASA